MARAPCVLVTGATGFVGTWLIKRLRGALSPDARVVALSHGPVNGLPRLDVTDAAATDELIRRTQPSAVVHLAAVSSQVDSVQAGRHSWMVNLFGTMNLAEAVLRHAPQARFIFSGSSEAYGASFDLLEAPLDERAPLAPRNLYAATKAAADLMLGQMAEVGLRAVRFRPFNHTGPGQSDAFVVPAFASQIAAIERGEQSPVISVGNLEVQRDFLDVRDVVDAYALAVCARELRSTCVINLASGVPRRIGDVLQALLAMSANQIEIRQEAGRLRSNDTSVAVGDARRAFELLGWRPRVEWKTTLFDVLDSFRHRC